MTLPPFEVHAPETAGEATELLERHGDEAVVLCGGTELPLVMKLGFREYGHLVDVTGIGELRRLELDGEMLVTGAGGCPAARRAGAARAEWFVAQLAGGGANPAGQSATPTAIRTRGRY